jgi:hypothetical protein
MEHCSVLKCNETQNLDCSKMDTAFGRSSAPSYRTYELTTVAAPTSIVPAETAVLRGRASTRCVF